jgi:SAM-dependent methyltransferase
MIPGDDAFYLWISKFADYYPGKRWEWSVVLKEMRESGPAAKTLLDVGCGSGAFLKFIATSLPNAAAIGLDPTKSAIQRCKAHGLEAFSQTLQEYAADSCHAWKQFDYVCVFHCLEHISDPKGLLRAIMPLTHSESLIFVSTPYSPMSFEGNWYDPLNHPPHHMTRWNAAAYNEIAAQLGYHVDLLVPRAANIFVRALTAVNLTFHGPHGGGSHPIAAPNRVGRGGTAANGTRTTVRSRRAGCRPGTVPQGKAGRPKWNHVMAAAQSA